MGPKQFPGVLQIAQIGPNTAVFGDAILKLPSYDLADLFNAVGSSPFMRAIFPNVPDASRYLGEIMDKSLGEEGVVHAIVGKPLNRFTGTNLVTYGQNAIPGGAGASLPLVGRGGGRGRG